MCTRSAVKGRRHVPALNTGYTSKCCDFFVPTANWPRGVKTYVKLPYVAKREFHTSYQNFTIYAYFLSKPSKVPYYRAGVIRSEKSILFLSSLIAGNSCCVWIIALVQLIESMTDKRAIISAHEWAEKNRFFWSYGASAIIRYPSRS